MPNSKIAVGLEKLVKVSATLIGKMQIGANKILWGSANTQPVQTVKYNPATTPGSTGSLSYTSTIPNNPKPPKTTLVNSGVYNALDALNSVDLCNVLTYAFDNINIKKKPRPEPPWTEGQRILYRIQDQAQEVQITIDKYLAYPSTFVNTYIGPGIKEVPASLAATQSNAPTQGGVAVTAYNTYFLMQAVTDILGGTEQGTGSLLTAEERSILASVPGLAANINVVNDFIGSFTKYADYTQINNEELNKLIKKINTLRSICVTIQTLDLKNALALAGNLVGIDIRSEIQKLGKFIDPTVIVKTLKDINSAIRAFIRIGTQVQGIIRTGQFILKIGILLYKVFKFILAFFGLIPIPSATTTVGAQTKIQDAKNAAKNESDGVMRILRAVNGLMEVALIFVRYVLTNANEILTRLQVLLTNLEACEAMKDSDVLKQLQQTAVELQTLRDTLAAYVIQYDSKTDPNTAIFGGYDIRVVEEEITDIAVINKRRRGIALNQQGVIVVASDLTFATNTAVIIGEVQQKLMALKLVQPSLGLLDGANLDTIRQSLNYLDSNDVLSEDLNLSQETLNALRLDDANNTDDTQGIGLNAFINNLPGGKRLRQRARQAMGVASTALKSQLDNEKVAAQEALKPK